MFDDYDKLNTLYMNAHTHRSKSYLSKKNDEEFFYADVEKTRTQFTQKQHEQIKKKYDIPVSVKIAHAIIKQTLSFITGTKPAFQYITESYNDQDYSEMYQELTQAIWYESKMNSQLAQMITDSLVVGDGYIHIRQSDFFNESTFGVVLEHCSWKQFLFDPASRKPDLSDMSYAFKVAVMTVDAAEKKYDIKIDYDNGNQSKLAFPYEIDEELTDRSSPYYTGTDKTRYTLVRECYQKEFVKLWIDENGNVTNKRPKPITAPNPAYLKLQSEYLNIKNAHSHASSQLLAYQEKEQQQVNELATGTNQAATMQQMEQSESQSSGLKEQVRQLSQQLKDIEYSLASTPETVPAYQLLKLGEEEPVIAYEISKQERKRIVYSLIVHDKILERKVLPIDEIPIINCAYLHNDSPAKSYGLMHLLKDFEKAMNKFLQGAIYNVQLSGSPRVLAAEGTIVNRESFESTASLPGGLIEYTLNPDLNGKDIPQFISPQAISEAHVRLIEICMQMSEYVSGIHSIAQGNSENAPNSLGGINSILTFGTQRIKDFGRTVEDTLQRMAYVLVQFLHAYTPRDKVLRYFDENNDTKEVQMLNTPEDIRFRVRANVVNSMPVQKQLSALLLSTISGQTSSPEVANLLIEEAIKNMDIPQSRELLQRLDVVKLMQQQIQQLTQQNDFKDAQLRMLENNMANKEIAQKQKEAEMEIEYETQRQLENVQQQEQQYEPAEVSI